MAKSSKATASTTVEKTVSKPVQQMVPLRLTQNDFVRGVFAKAGKVFEFTKSEADKRLATEMKWEYAV